MNGKLLHCDNSQPCFPIAVELLRAWTVGGSFNTGVSTERPVNTGRTSAQNAPPAKNDLLGANIRQPRTLRWTRPPAASLVRFKSHGVPRRPRCRSHPIAPALLLPPTWWQKSRQTIASPPNHPHVQIGRFESMLSVKHSEARTTTKTGAPGIQQSEGHDGADETGAMEGSLVEDMAYQRDVSMELARKLSQDLDAKKKLLGGRLQNALRLSSEAEIRLNQANREYQVKHLTLRKRMLTIVATLALASLIGWLISALLTHRFQLGAVLILPLSVMAGIYLFGKLEGEDGLLSLAWS